jgi:glycosyltransferase involved in cell wall biosynthesis
MLTLLSKANGIQAEAACPGAGVLAKALAARGIRTHALEFNKYAFSRRPDWHFRFYLRFRRILEESGAEVVVINLDGNVPPVTLAANHTRVPIIRFSRLEFTPPRRWVDRHCWLSAAAVICPSESVRHQVLLWAPPRFRERVHCWYDPLASGEVSDSEISNLRAELGLGSVKVVGFVGRLHFRKGIETLFYAMHEIRKQAPDTVLLLVGSHDGSPDGVEYARKLEVLAREFKLQDAVRFLGYRKDVPAVLSACDVCVLPSESESFGMVLTEAWAVGVPTVASDVGGCREITLASGGGQLCPVGNAGLLARGILKIVSNRELAMCMATSGRAWVHKNCDPAHYAGRFQELVDQLRPCSVTSASPKWPPRPIY